MRIVIAGQAYFQEDNGQAAFTVRLCQGLAQAGHQVLAFAPSRSNKPAKTVSNGLTLCTVPAVHLAHNVNISYGSGRLVKQRLAGFRPDIVHIQDHYFLSRTVFRCARDLKLPVVGSNHFLPDNLTDNLRIPRRLVGLIQGLLWRHMKSLYNRLQAISTPTGTAAAILSAQRLIPPITAISCGVDTARFQPTGAIHRREIRKQYGAGEAMPTFIYIGRVDREKGLATILRALALLPEEKVQLIIGGRGSFRKELQQLTGELHLEHRVFFPGYIPADDLPPLLCACDCFVMAGHAELQSIATLEAMACGLPVLAANAAALPELVGAGINGELFAPGDVNEVAAAMMRLLTAKDQWPRMGGASRCRALDHDQNKTVAAYEQWYRGICGMAC